MQNPWPAVYNWVKKKTRFFIGKYKRYIIIWKYDKLVQHNNEMGTKFILLVTWTKAIFYQCGPPKKKGWETLV